MHQRNNQVFQLSLTELAFMIAFILLLLLGYLVIKEHSERTIAEKALEKVQRMERVAIAADSAKSRFETALRESGASNPDEAITHLIAAEELRAERDHLKQRILDLEAKLTSLTKLQTLLENVAISSTQNVTKDRVIAALALQEQVSQAFEEELRQELKPGQEAQTLREVMRAAKSFNEFAKSGENLDSIRKVTSDLKGQVAFLKNRLDARGGRDYPPCWVDESGKIEFLFTVELRTDSVAVLPAWPKKREADARSLPGIDNVLANVHSHQDFPKRIQGVFDWSTRQNPQCRHYVHIKSSIPDAVQSDRARLMVENYFYKLEARR